LIRLERALTDLFFAVLQRALKKGHIGKRLRQIVGRRDASETALRGKYNANFIFEIGTLCSVRIILIAVAFPAGEFWVVRQHVAEGMIFREAVARSLHRFFHFRSLVGRVGASLALGVRAEATMARDVTENDRQFVVRQKAAMRRSAKGPRRNLRS
jgi:hypothetical protein